MTIKVTVNAKILIISLLFLKIEMRAFMIYNIYEYDAIIQDIADIIVEMTHLDLLRDLSTRQLQS